MFRKFLPRDTSFFDYFEKHTQVAVQAALELQVLVESATSIPEHAKRVKDLEHQADVLTHQCKEALHKTFITPLDRDDIYQLISGLDDIVDHLDAAAEHISLYRLTAMTPEVKALTEVVVASVREVHEATKQLRDLRNTATLRQHCIQINLLENQADGLLRQGVSRLFDEEPDARNIIKWKEVYENLEDATDGCEDVANLIEGIILEHD